MLTEISACFPRRPVGPVREAADATRNGVRTPYCQAGAKSEPLSACKRLVLLFTVRGLESIGRVFPPMSLHRARVAPHLSRRAGEIESFRVMKLLARARELEAAGRDIIHMEVGEPDFDTPEPITAAGQAALAAGRTHYTPATGLPALRRAIAEFYHQRYQTRVDPERILVTPGASGALMLACAALLDEGDGVLLADPGYPCNRNFVRAFGGVPQHVEVGAETGYQLSAELVRSHWRDTTRAVVLASPSNPTGTVIGEVALQGVIDEIAACGGTLISDEIYHGLTYGDRLQTALALSEDVFVLNSFSKYFGMTGWRLGWIVAPEWAVDALDRMAQNLYIAAPTIAQHAALAAFSDQTLKILEQRRDAFRARRDFLMPALQDLGLKIRVCPQGAFYLYADVSTFTNDAQQFCETLLEVHGVAATPGLDFGNFRAAEHVRFAYTTDIDRLQLGVERLARALQQI